MCRDNFADDPSGATARSEQFPAPWAKRAPDGSWHSVIAHSLDVGVVARRLMGRPVLRARMSAAFGIELTDVHLDRLALLAGLHDAGKCLSGFQAKLTHTSGIGQGHVAEFLAALMASEGVRKAVDLEVLAGWFERVEDAVLASICHHGQPADRSSIDRRLSEVEEQLSVTVHGHDPVSEIRRLSEAMSAAFPGSRETSVCLSFRPMIQHLFAGVVMTADWMASNSTRFPYLNGGEKVRTDCADRLLESTGWSGWSCEIPSAALLGKRTPRPVQAAIQTVPLAERLVVIEAPTGSGKTEAALIHANRLVDSGLVDGLYFAVPSRSAATELHARIARAMTAVHPNLVGKVVRAVPGMLDVDPGMDIHDEAERSWALHSPKTVFAAPVAVGTVDQALLSILRVRHGWLRAACLSRHLLVIDEVHASDPYMSGIIGALVDRHLDLGGHVLAMSATLGEAALARLQRRQHSPFEQAIEIPYPAIRTSRVSPIGKATPRAVDITLAGFDECLAASLASAKAGQCVLLIRSTVTDAVETWRQISHAGIETMLHHSRYALHDRGILDRRLLEVMGPAGRRRGLVAVTTQTAEQSLDIDADLLISDACPADVLLQRLGRLHRHREGTRPVALMINPGDLARYLTPDGRVRGLEGQGWAWVYDNLLSVGQTVGWIAENRLIVVPDDSRELVERATHPEFLRDKVTRMGAGWLQLWERLYTQASRQRELAETGIADWNRDYAETLVNERIVTRLGDGTVDIAVELVSPFDGTAISRISVPARWLRDTPDDVEVISKGNEVAVGDLCLRYDRTGLHRVPGHSGSGRVGNRPRVGTELRRA